MKITFLNFDNFLVRFWPIFGPNFLNFQKYLFLIFKFFFIKMKKIDKNVKQCKKMQKMGLKRPKSGTISEQKLSSFFWLETTSKNGTSSFH